MSALPSQGLMSPIQEQLRFTVQSPATSANLGPGYDCLGLALELRDSIFVTAQPRLHAAEPQLDIEIEGQGASSLPADASHMVVSAIAALLHARGYQLPDLRIRAVNRIPHSRGLGSSAAAVVTAVLIADRLLPEGLSANERFQIGSRIEGHPDNYAPALFGGIRLSWCDNDGDSETPGAVGTGLGREFSSVALTPHEDLHAVIAIPAFTQSTAVARQLLPEQVPHAVAAEQAGRVGLLVHGLTQDPDLLLAGTEDRLHQEFRRSAFAPSMALVDDLRSAGLAAVISGAGPAVLVLGNAAAASQSLGLIAQFNDSVAQTQHFHAENLPIALSGATVEPTRDFN